MNHLRVYDPFARSAVHDTLNDIVREFIAPARADQQALAIRSDVSETDNAYVVRAEIPGVRKEDIQVTIDGGEVTIGAEVKRGHEARDGERVLRSERYEGSAFRSYAFASDIDEAASEAKYADGVLQLTLVKKAQPAGRKLAVQ
jgi:HSP20 family protein